MKKVMLRTLALLLSLALALAACGCKKREPTLETPVTVKPQPAVTDAPAASSAEQPTAAPPPVQSASERFSELDAAFFRDYVTSDGYTYHQFIADGARYGIDENEIEMTLGDFSEEADAETCARYGTYLEALHAIEREALTESEQMSYDVLEQYLSSCTAGDAYDYYYEPLEHYSGVHSTLPLSFALYEIESERDVENYLLLLADTPRFLGQILDYEKERASRGMFMTASALSDIVQDCDDIINARDTFYLIGTFNEAVDALAGLTAEKAEAYKKQNEALIKGSFIDAYVTLRDGLQALSAFCRAEEGMYAFGNDALAYFELAMRDEGCTDMSVDDALELLSTEMYNLLISMYTYMNTLSDVNAAVNGLNVTKGSAEADLAFLQTITGEILPPMPNHALTLSDVPEELENQMNPAAYVIPSVDDWYQNEILINPTSANNTMLFTYAHEAYPGHMYQYLYARSLENLGLSRQILHFVGYSEAWSQLSVEFMLAAQSDFPLDACMVAYYNEIIASTLLPAMVSILVNYKMYDKAGVEEFLGALEMEAYADIYYSLAVEMPFYAFPYALGYAQFASMLRDARNDLGDAFDQRSYLTAFLNLGPAYFNLLTERMDVWVDAQITA